jgi:proteasome accessory factor BC
VLIAAGRAGRRPPVSEVLERLQISEQELREDISVLNVVNFGGGAYVIYAEVQGDEIEIDTEPYSDTFDRPARLLPIEANALMAAIEFLGTHLSDHLQTAHDKIKAALGEIGRDGLLVGGTGADDSDIARDVSRAIESRNLIELEYWQPNEDTISERKVEPYALMNGREGWYIASFDPSRDDTRSFRLDRVKRVTVLDEVYEPRASVDEIAVVEGWPRTGEVEGSRVAHVWISPEQARWSAEEHTVLAELPDGAVIIEWAYKGEDYLVKEVLKEAGDAAVLEPADAREAVLRAAERLLVAAP